MPSLIATYLNLPTPNSFYRTLLWEVFSHYARNLSNSKKQGGKLSAVAEGYVDSTITQKNKISNKILMDDGMRSTSKQSVSRSYSFTSDDSNREFE
ncbi:hypothetical protein JTB14_001765 [Gonioctena quinquepunctata]|nr:hypothetical protein JTB14_001765 [Gonioctena quinquepunctata]